MPGLLARELQAGVVSFDWSGGWRRCHGDGWQGVRLWPEEARPALSSRNRMRATCIIDNVLVATLKREKGTGGINFNDILHLT